MHGWNDPRDPEADPRRPELPTEDPAWLTDRPAPRSAYLFGDEPGSSTDRWYDDQPTEQWQPEAPHSPRGGEADWRSGQHHHAIEPETGYYEPTDRGGTPGGPAGRGIPGWPASADHDRTARHAAPETGHHGADWDTQVRGYSAPAGPASGSATGPDQDRYGRYGATADQSRYDATVDHGRYGATADQSRYDMTVEGGYGTAGDRDDLAVEGGYGTAAGPHGRYDPPADQRNDAGQRDEPTGSDERGARRRLRRPLVLGGAAAAATLVVSIGVAALALPGDDTPTDRTAADIPPASAPALPDETTDLALDPSDSPSPSPSPSVSPSTASPSPSPSRTSSPTPAASRTTAPSRQNADRQGSPNRASTPSATPSSGTTSQAAEVVRLVNVERAKEGCGALSIDDKLMTAAQRHSQDQADTQNMSHTGSDGSNPGTRLDRVDYTWRTYGENVAWNQRTPAAVMDAWMNSEGHRANILNCAFTEIGVGVASSNGPYWTQVFAAPR
ncbi:CAP domain-containing protein [Verrucosispora sp. SN26_14.1]|uniref:CAP domain-containing protein n=1 Tax=Verrucosispora sp. SN26_14.1 TaxID=2527879 RepID=UPI0010353EDF|nr:CAP domain-containing protein [Verrucosispora sp. SN26_14.1]TBL31668.1 CAP domain-containing protein [Verrucosispora sp. SN26_14.1]